MVLGYISSTMGVKIFWAVVVGFLTGVFVRSFVPLGASFAGLCALIACALLVFAYINQDKGRDALIAAVALIALGGGILRMDMATLSGDPQLSARLDTHVVLTGSVIDEPDVREDKIYVPVAVDRIKEGSASIPVKATILASVPSHTAVSYGDQVRVMGTLRAPQPFDSGEGRQFDYPSYLAVSGITYQLANAQLDRTGTNNGNAVKAAAIDLKHYYVHGLEQALPEPESGLAGGITVGDKRSVGQELSDTFRKVSLVHIVVLSGYNITVVINAIAKVCAPLPQLARFGISGFAVLFFILMAGGAASAVRSGAMAFIAMYARVSGRVFLASRALAAVSLLMILWNPFTLAFDPSFQLSALATIGLITFTPIFAGYLYRIPETLALREVASSTLGTQLAVLPLLLYQNGQLSLMALPANLLALFPIPMAMLASLISAIAGDFLGPIAPIVGFPAYILLSYVIGVARVLASLPFAAVAVPAFSALWMFAAYAVLFLGAAYFHGRGVAIQTKTPR